MAKELLDIIYCFKQWAPVLELQIVLHLHDHDKQKK